jgi:hypothetical protein
LSHTSRPFSAVGLFLVGSHFMPGPAWTVTLLFMLPAKLGWDGISQAFAWADLEL